MQEYGQSNGELLDALRGRGAQVRTVSVYGWALPEDLGPLQDAIRAIAGGEVDAALFTSAQQVRHLVDVARTMDLERGLRAGLQRVVIGSIGPTCSDTLRELGLGVDFEPDRTRMGDLVRGMARSARLLLCRKRASAAAGVDVVTAARVDLTWPADVCGANADPLHDSPFLRACRRERVPYTPIWIMRQAGRYLREYRELRAKVSFLEMCKRPELAAEVTLHGRRSARCRCGHHLCRHLVVVEPMGVGLTFNEGEGPRIPRPVRTTADVDALREVDPGALGYVFEAIRMARRALRPDVPLIGFCGAPFTVASYMIEGGAGRNFQTTKTLMYRDAGAWKALMERLVDVLAGYLNGQIDAGVQAVQIFDSWAAVWARTITALRAAASRSAGPRGQAGRAHHLFRRGHGFAARIDAGYGVDVIGLDWRLGLGHAWERLGYDVAVQGNLDPAVLFATPAEIERQARRILDEAGGRPGHIFNLGHGILPDTPVDHAWRWWMRCTS